MRKVAVVTLAALTVLLAACSSSPSHPAASSVHTNASTDVAAQFAVVYSPLADAGQSYNGAVNLININLTQEQQRINQDNATITSTEFGAGCTVSLTDPTQYTNCLASETQTEANARSDLAAAESAEDQDAAQYDSAATTYQSAVDTFIGKLPAIPWPSQDVKTVGAVITAGRTLGADLVDASSAPAPETGTSEQIGIGAQNFGDAVNALKDDLGLPAS